MTCKQREPLKFRSALGERHCWSHCNPFDMPGRGSGGLQAQRSTF